MKFKSKLSILLLSTSLICMQVKANEVSSKEMIDPMGSEDPYESFNRTMFNFNMEFNTTIGRPIAEAYSDFVPQPAQTGFKNFFNNLATPLSSLNSFLQGNVEDGLSSFMRFTINSTFGLFGLLDIATPAGLEQINEDFGQTLYKWGVWNEANYVVLPFLGPYTTRGLVSGSVEGYYDPIYPNVIDTDTQGRALLFTGKHFVNYVEAIRLIDELKNQPDPYVFARESYLQYRTNLIYNGNAPQADLDDFDFE